MSRNSITQATGEIGINELLAEYLKAVDRGQVPAPAELLARHPEHRGELEAFFAAQESADRWTGPLREMCSTARDQQTLGGDETSAMPLPGDGVIGDYELLGEIARGGMGVVYRARQKRLDRVVALKMILAGRLATAADVQRLRSEAQAAARLDHPNIVPIYEVSQHEGRHFLTMKLIDGGNLAQALAATPASYSDHKGRRRAAELLAKAARAVHYAHQHGILHRDLKPANILLDAHGEPHVSDFGLAKRVDEPDGSGTLQPALTQTGAILGTPSYMPPEQAGGDRALTTAADTYSLGAILFELLTGRPPFRGATAIDTVLQVRDHEPPRPRALRADIDYDLETICLKCLEKDPAKRYESAQALADDLQRWLADEPIQGRRAGSWERTHKWVKRHKTLSALMGTASVAAACLVVLAGFLWHNAELRAEAVQDLGQARRELGDARVAKDAAAKDVEQLQAAAKDEQAKLEELRALAAAERAKAKTARREADHILFAANMQFAAAAWESADMARFFRLLEQHEPAKNAEDLRGFEWHYLNKLGQRGHKTLTESGTTVCLSADGKTCSTIGMDNTIRLWDVASGKLLQSIDGPATVLGQAFSSDAGQLLLLSVEIDKKGDKVKLEGPLAPLAGLLRLHTINLKDPKDRKIEAFDPVRLPVPVSFFNASEAAFELMVKGMIKLDKGRIMQPLCLALSPDRKTLAVGGLITSPQGGGNPNFLGIQQEGALLLWDLVSNKEKALIKAHESMLISVAFARDGGMATGSMNRTIRLWDADNKLLRTLRGHRAPVVALHFAPDGKLYSGGIDGIIHSWEVASGTMEKTLRGHESGVISLAVTGDGQRVLSATDEGVVKRWETAALSGPKPREIAATVHSLKFAPDGKTLLALDQAGRLSAWDPSDGKEPAQKELFGARGPFLASAISADGKLLAASTLPLLSSAISIRSAADGKQLLSLTCKQGEDVIALVFSPDSKLLACALSVPAKPGEVLVMSVETGKELYRLRGFDKDVTAVAFSPDGKHLAAGGLDGKVRLVNPADGKLRYEFEQPVGVATIAFSADSSVIALAGIGSLRLHHTADGKEKLMIATYGQNIVELLFSPDGKRLVTASGADDRSRGNGVKLWDLVTGRETLTLGDPNAIISALAFSPDGTRLAAAYTEENIVNFMGTGNKSTVHVWEAGK